MRPLTEQEQAYIRIRREIQQADQEEAERMASVQLWRDSEAEDWVGDAQRAMEEVNAVRAARAARSAQDLRIRMLQAELDLD